MIEQNSIELSPCHSNIDSNLVVQNNQKIYPPVGIFAVLSDGRQLLVDNDFDTSNNPNVVALLLRTNNVEFAIDKNCNARGGVMWSAILSNTNVNGIVDSWTDYDGFNNSQIIRSLTEGEDNAANYCYSKSITIDGQTIYGYLGSTGEYMEMFNRRIEIDNALKLIGGSTLTELNNNSDNLYLITSTEDPADPTTLACYVCWYDLGIYKYGKTRTDGNYYSLPLYRLSN